MARPGGERGEKNSRDATWPIMGRVTARRSYAKGIAKREEVLRAGLTVFAKNGYQKTSIRELAEAANLSQAGLLHYFGSKEELLVAILDRREQENQQEGTDSDALDLFFDVVRRNVAVPGLAQLFAVMSTCAIELAHPAHEFFLDRNERLRNRLGDAIRARQQAGEITTALDSSRIATLLIATADGLQVQWLIDPDVEMSGVLEDFWVLIRAA